MNFIYNNWRSHTFSFVPSIFLRRRNTCCERQSITRNEACRCHQRIQIDQNGWRADIDWPPNAKGTQNGRHNRNASGYRWYNSYNNKRGNIATTDTDIDSDTDHSNRWINWSEMMSRNELYWLVHYKWDSVPENLEYLIHVFSLFISCHVYIVVYSYSIIRLQWILCIQIKC